MTTVRPFKQCAHSEVYFWFVHHIRSHHVAPPKCRWSSHSAYLHSSVLYTEQNYQHHSIDFSFSFFSVLSSALIAMFLYFGRSWIASMNAIKMVTKILVKWRTKNRKNSKWWTSTFRLVFFFFLFLLFIFAWSQWTSRKQLFSSLPNVFQFWFPVSLLMAQWYGPGLDSLQD